MVLVGFEFDDFRTLAVIVVEAAVVEVAVESVDDSEDVRMVLLFDAGDGAAATNGADACVLSIDSTVASFCCKL